MECQRNPLEKKRKKNDLIPNSWFCLSLPSESVHIRDMAYDRTGEKVGGSGAQPALQLRPLNGQSPLPVPPGQGLKVRLEQQGGPCVVQVRPSLHSDCCPKLVQSVKSKRPYCWLDLVPDTAWNLAYDKWAVNVGNNGTRDSQSAQAAVMSITCLLSWRQLCDWLEER